MIVTLGEPAFLMADETNRFTVRQEEAGTWAVCDVFTGWPTDYLGRILENMDEDNARSMCMVVNAMNKYCRRLANRERGCSL